jgi:hypothetical protein
MTTITRLAACLLLLGACNDPGGGNGNGGGDGGTGNDGCVGLECQQVECQDGAKTTVTGTVTTPAGNLPLYNVTVFVPNSELSELPAGVSCDRCGALVSGNPIAKTTTDTNGRFVLENVPVGEAIPIVIQTGKWRRSFKLAKVEKCVENATEAGQTRLPKDRSEGDMPQIALTTGDADALECLLRKIGIADSEITASTGTGKVHLFYGEGGTDRFSAASGGAMFTEAETALWNSADNLNKYDAIFLSCEGAQNFGNNKDAAAAAAVKEYAGVGGRVFATHWHNTWLEDGPADWRTVSTIDPHPDLTDEQDLTEFLEVDIDQGSATGARLAEWLLNVDASTTLGKVSLRAVQHTIEAVSAAATRYLYLDTTANNAPSVQAFSFNTPIDVMPRDQCGKVVFTDIHVSSGDTSVAGTGGTSTPFPTGCTTTDFTAQEKLLAFMLFDITACIAPPVE